MIEPDAKRLIEQTRALLEARRKEYVGELESLDAASAAETKSSAGDKYETAREMIAQSRILSQRNLSETEANLDLLERMAAAPPAEAVGFGSLVETSQGWYWVGISLGELDSAGGTIRTISLASPLGKALRGARPGDRIPWRGGSIEVLRLAGGRNGTAGPA